jgi:putative thioredoxin
MDFKMKWPGSTPAKPQTAPMAAPATAPASAPRTGLAGATGSPAGAMTAGDLIKETTTASFMKDVIETSKQVPVLVDFWAPWCGPCKQLTPILEKIIKELKGAVRLVKMNIDAHPSVAQQMRVQSIPAVFAFVDGRPIDGFMGALPETQIRQFIDRILGEAGGADGGLEEAMAAAAQALEAGDFQGAAEVYAAILQEDRQNVEALAGLAKCYVKTNDLDLAEQTLGLVPPDKKDIQAVAAVRAAIDLARKGAKAGDTAALAVKVEQEPTNHQARYDLALALIANGDRENGLDHLLDIMRRNRQWNEDGARKQIVQLFEVWGPKDPLTIDGRRRLSSVLFA